MFLRAEGRFFSAGANLSWMRKTAQYSREENVRDAELLGEMLHTLDTLPLATVALVQGPAFGGGVGLISCCDIAVAVSTASFTLSEVKLGLIPATISPYVIKRIGPQYARRFFLTAEQIESEMALRIGLVHEVVSDAQQLVEMEHKLMTALLAAAPSGVGAAKDLIHSIAGQPVTRSIIADTVSL